MIGSGFAVMIKFDSIGGGSVGVDRQNIRLGRGASWGGYQMHIRMYILYRSPAMLEIALLPFVLGWSMEPPYLVIHVRPKTF